MALEKVKAYMKKFNADSRILEFAESSATVELAAKAAGTQPERIAKSLTFMVNDAPIMIVAAGDAKVDNGKYKAEYATKAKMLTAEQVDQLIGHGVGGVCPFGINDGVKVYLDKSLQRFTTVFPACGSSNSAIELSITELEQFAQGFVKWVDVCKNWQE